MKKLISLVMAGLMLLSALALASCKKEPKPQPSQTEASATTSDNSNNPIPNRTFDGRTFTMLCREARINQFDVDKDKVASKLDSEVYSRNKLVEQTYDVNIKMITCPDGDSKHKGVEFNQRLETSSLGGCTDYDVVAPDYYWGCETHGYFTNLLELPNLNFESPWWWSAWNDCFTIGGNLTSAVGWLTLDIVQGMEVVYFNKTMAAALEVDNLYEKVRSGEWTIEEMKTLSIKAADPEQATPVYGTILHYMGMRNMIYSLGAQLSTYDEGGNVQFTFNTPKNQTVADKLHAWVFDGVGDVFYCAYNEVGHNLGVNENPTVTAQMFAENRALFYCYGIKTAELLATNHDTLDFGILPAPTLKSGDPLVSTTFGTSYFSVERGRNEEQKDFASFILEALNYYSYTMVKDVYYKQVLKLQYADDLEDSEMIDYVIENAYLDFAYLTDNYTGHLLSYMEKSIVEGTGLDSRWESIGTKAQTRLQDYIDGYKK